VARRVEDLLAKDELPVLVHNTRLALSFGHSHARAPFDALHRWPRPVAPAHASRRKSRRSVAGQSSREFRGELAALQPFRVCEAQR
jgi:hypothetical protein